MLLTYALALQIVSLILHYFAFAGQRISSRSPLQ